jgi:hypothetical protein
MQNWCEFVVRGRSLMDLTHGWTGETACALQGALRMSNERFAEHLRVGVRTVATWHQKPELRPQSGIQQALDTALDRASASARERFEKLTTISLNFSNAAEPEQVREQAAADAARRLADDQNISAALSWLDQHATWPQGTSRHEVAARLAQLDLGVLHERGRRRGRINQRQVAHALAEYYRDRPDGHGLYGARYGDQEVATSILTTAAWLDLECALASPTDRLGLGSATTRVERLDTESAERSAQRLAETLALGVRFVDMPLYRLLDVSPQNGEIDGTVEINRFLHYALTVDLLEAELIDNLQSGATLQRGTLPLRDRYLPDIASVLDLPGRLCAGGTLALCAIARPASYWGAADYVLLVQERSGNVVNAAGRLAVIPKGFHQPLTDYRADAQIGATLRREMEEELFGRNDIDNTLGKPRSADPMHPNRLSEPMRWLTERAGRMRMEGTGFGFNLVSGNYEFSSLIIIDDDEFWFRYGGQIEANWESSVIRKYSSLDRELLTELVGDVNWSNEGLFAFLQGLRRLKQIGGERVDLPTIEWETR